jgi:ethanolamine utilization protein EutN
MLIGEVVGNLVSTQKNAQLDGTKLLFVQPKQLDGTWMGSEVLAIDMNIQAGVGDTVLFVQDGKAAQHVLGRGVAAVDAAIVGIVDRVDLKE